MPVVLASSSPRRKELLGRAGIDFEVIPSPAEEVHDPSMSPAALCELNATLKAEAVAVMRPDATVIGSDTLVFIDNDPLGKPADHAAARTMLARLAGRTHQVRTGVCVIFPGGTARAVAHTLQGYYSSLHQHQTSLPWRDQMLDFDGLNALIGTPELLATGQRYEG